MRSSANHSARERYLLYFVVAVGLVLRLTLHFRGFNFDVISYRIVLQIMRDGGNVYQDTVRYNYGPVWFNILHLLDITPPLSFPPMDAFRWKLVLLLTAADMGIFVFLLRHYSLRIAALFFLNPISIIITGYHNQFDNIAVFVGLLAVFLYQKGDRKNRVLGMLGMGLSLCLKHLLFLFPVWLALKEKKWSWRVLVVLVPYAMFLLSFLPYWSTGAAGIKNNVFSYRSWENAPLWSMLLPITHLPFPKRDLFLGAMMIAGVVWRKRSPLNSLYLYLISLVAFSSAVTNQYLAICAPAIAVLWNWGFAVYTVLGTLILAYDPDGLRFTPPWHVAPVHKYDGAILALALGLLIAVFLRPDPNRASD